MIFILEKTKLNKRTNITINVVIKMLEERNCTIVGHYENVNARCKIEYTCNFHQNKGIQRTTYDRLKQGKGCKYCGAERIAASRRKYTIEEVREVFESKGCTLLSTEFKTVDHNLDYICENGHHGKVTFYEFKNDSYCKHCRAMNYSGEKHWNWNGGITSQNEKIRKSDSYLIWRESVFERDSYTCQCCLIRGTKFHAHHIYGFANNEELRLEINNGLTLCENCHAVGIPNSFHNVYGTINTTKEQLIEYITNKRTELGISAEMPFLLL